MSLPRWKKEQGEIKKKRLRLWIKLGRGLIFTGLIIFLALVTIKIYKNSLLLSGGRSTIVFQANPVLLISFDDANSDLVAILLPENSNPGEILNIPIDGIIKNWKLETGSPRSETIKNGLGSIKALTRLREAKTNLSLFDLLKVWWRVRNIRVDKINFSDLRDIKSAFGAGFFKDSQITNENLTIEVLNASQKPLLANRVAGLITNFGANVISVGNAEKEIESCEIRGQDSVLKSKTSQKLAKVYHCKMISGELVDSRADLQIIIGRDDK